MLAQDLPIRVHATLHEHMFIIFYTTLINSFLLEKGVLLLNANLRLLQLMLLLQT